MKQTITILTFTLFTIGMFAQKNTVATGNTISGVNGSASYTIGQIDFQLVSSASGYSNEGVQQPIEIYTLSLKEFEVANFSVFPNPATDYLTITVTEGFNGSYTIFDINGKQMKSSELNQLEQQIDVQNLSTGVYLLNVFSDSKLKKQIKIIKK